MKPKPWMSFLVLLLALAALAFQIGLFAKPNPSSALEPADLPPGMARATFAGGCFWCTEAVFQKLKGVQSVVSGYTGGTVENPTYRQICTGNTGHAEAIQITYDPTVISFAKLLEVFWATHDPTTRDRQGNDVGPQYRSAVFYHNEEQKQFAEALKTKLDTAGVFDGPIVTEIVPAADFFRADPTHQNYYERNTTQPYCRVIIGPKLEKLRKAFPDNLKNP